MHCNETKHTPLWYCVYNAVSKEVVLNDKTEPGKAKCTDITTEKDLAADLTKVICDDRTRFISELNADDVIFNEVDVKL